MRSQNASKNTLGPNAAAACVGGAEGVGELRGGGTVASASVIQFLNHRRVVVVVLFAAITKPATRH